MVGTTNFEVVWCTSDGMENTKLCQLVITIDKYIDYGIPPTSNIISENSIPYIIIIPIR